MMKAIVLKEHGDISALEIKEREIPHIEANEVLIKVAAAGLNRADIVQRQGYYPAPKDTVQDVLGLEVSGEIAEVGANVNNWEVGDKVCALLAGGGYAEYVRVDASSCMPIPQGVSIQDASAIPEALCTVWLNLFQTGKLSKNQDALIYGGSGGIGSMAIQLVHLFGAHAFTLASSKEKIDFCKEMGAKKVIDYTKEDIIDVLGKNSVDVILEMVGGDYLNKNLILLREEGKMVFINSVVRNSDLHIFRMMQKRITITGSTLRSRSIDFKRKLIEDIKENAYPLIEDPGFKNIVKHRFHYTQVQEAHKLMESRDFYGKIILQFD